MPDDDAASEHPVISELNIPNLPDHLVNGKRRDAPVITAARKLSGQIARTELHVRHVDIHEPREHAKRIN